MKAARALMVPKPRIRHSIQPSEFGLEQAWTRCSADTEGLANMPNFKSSLEKEFTQEGRQISESSRFWDRREIELLQWKHRS
ncbi:hypothetical protein C1J03_22600 [Sulfitobacter sp. SK012]|nr:hypothetical protein C1J03_22600 [Sulfitobacter sp. SK012]